MAPTSPTLHSVIKETRRVPLAELQQHPRNPNNGDVEEIAGSLAENGLFRPIVVQASTGYILDGNHTYQAALANGWTEIEASFVDVPDERAYRILLVANAIARKARPDEALLLDILTELQETDAGLAGTGHTDLDVDDLAAILEETAARPIEAYNPDGPDAGGGPQPREGGATTVNGEDNSRFTPTYKDYAERYLDKATRVIVLEYPLAEYNALVERLAALRRARGVDNNSAVVAELVNAAEVPE